MGEGAGVPDCVKVEVCGAFASILHIILSLADLAFIRSSLWHSIHRRATSQPLKQKVIRKLPSPISPCPKLLPGQPRCNITPPSLSEASFDHPTYLDIPSFYLFAENDKVIGPEMQSMVDAANKLREIPIIEYAIPTGYFPFTSQPGMIVEVVRKVPGEKL
jgi:hypothetical protein